MNKQMFNMRYKTNLLYNKVMNYKIMKIIVKIIYRRNKNKLYNIKMYNKLN